MSQAPARIRVVRVIGRLNVGGPAIHVVNLTAGLDPARFDSHLVTGLENPGEGSLLDWAEARGVRPTVVPGVVNEATLTRGDAGAFRRLHRLLRQVRPHIVHTHTAKAGFLGRLAARAARVPVVVHTYHGHVLHSYYGRGKTQALRRMEQGLALLSDRLVAVSEQVKRDLVAYGVSRPHKIAVVPLGLDLEPFTASAAYRGEFRRELGLDGQAPLVGIVGRLFPIKNHALFLRAAAAVARRCDRAGFVVVGDGPLRPGLEAQARDLGIADRVVFAGWRRDLPRIYADLDVLVVSSHNEGTPVSGIEAMAAGRVVVATRVGGLPDLLADGHTGFLVPAGDEQAMAGTILRALGEPCTAARVGEAARASVLGRFAVGRLLDDVSRLYLDLLEAKGIVRC